MKTTKLIDILFGKSVKIRNVVLWRSRAGDICVALGLVAVCTLLIAAGGPGLDSVNGILTMVQRSSSPANPGTGNTSLFMRTNGRMSTRTSAGVESDLATLSDTWHGCTFSMSGGGAAITTGAHWEGAVYLSDAVTLTGWRCRGESGTSVITLKRVAFVDYYGAGTAILTGTTMGKTTCCTALATNISTSGETMLPADIYLVPYVTSASETILALDLLGHKTNQ